MIPLATTTVTVTAQSEPEPGDGITTSTRASGVRAVIASPSGAEVDGPGGGSERVDAVLVADTVSGISHTDRVTTAEGDSYEVVWVRTRTGLGVDHVRAGLVAVTGRAA